MRSAILPPSAPRRSRPRLRMRFILGGGILLILSFLAGLYLFFPTDALQARLEQEFAKQTGASLTMDDLALTFPPGLRGEGVTVGGLPGREPLEAPSVTVKPLWLTLFTASPGIRYSAQFLGGEISGKYRRGGDLKAEGGGLSFAEPLTPGSDVRAAGTLRQGIFTGSIPVRPETETALQFAVDDVRLTGLEKLGVGSGALPLGTVTVQGTGKGNALRIDTLEASGGSVAATGSGSLLLATPRDRTRINLNLTLRPAAGIDPGALDLLQIFAQPVGDGSYRFRVTGTLGTPVFAQ